MYDIKINLQLIKEGHIPQFMPEDPETRYNHIKESVSSSSVSLGIKFTEKLITRLEKEAEELKKSHDKSDEYDKVMVRLDKEKEWLNRLENIEHS
jgi:predicted DNA-binding protein YlxM (UPF0122 family)